MIAATIAKINTVDTVATRVSITYFTIRYRISDGFHWILSQFNKRSNKQIATQPFIIISKTSPIILDKNIFSIRVQII